LPEVEALGKFILWDLPLTSDLIKILREGLQTLVDTLSRLRFLCLIRLSADLELMENSQAFSFDITSFTNLLDDSTNSLLLVRRPLLEPTNVIVGGLAWALLLLDHFRIPAIKLQPGQLLVHGLG